MTLKVKKGRLKIFEKAVKNILIIFLVAHQENFKFGIWNNIMCNFKEKAEKQENSDRSDLTKYTEICEDLACQLPVYNSS